MDNEDTRVPTVHIESGGPIIDDTQLEHWGEKSGGILSPIGWDNVLLYGEYQLNRSLVRSERLSVSMIDKPPLPSVPEESRAGRRRGKR